MDSSSFPPEAAANKYNYDSFVASLKISSDGTVSDFVEDCFHRFCNPSSPEYDSSIDFAKLAMYLFPIGEKWINRDVLFRAVSAVAGVHGWQPTKDKKHIQCNRFGRDKTKREYRNGSLKQECSFRITLKPTYLKSSDGEKIHTKKTGHSLEVGPSV